MPAPTDARRPPLIDAAGIAALAFLLRFGIVLFSHGGPGGIYGYDAGVYYSAADALTFGRVPYHDFIFLHPPGLMLVLTPFAALGRLTTDHAGYITANVFFNLLAALSAVLVWRIASLWGFTRRAALMGGLFYAGWWGAISAEVGLRLEPLGSVVFLIGLYQLTRRRPLLAGLAFGAVCCVKIWWTAPVLLVLIWHLARRERRATGARLVAGVGLAAAAITGPFLALAGSEMTRRVVTDQLGRRYHTQPIVRIEYLAGLRKAFPSLPTPLVAVAVVVIGAAFVLAIRVAWRQPPARLVVAVLVAQFIVLMVSPSFFNFYSGFLPGTLALTVAAACQPAPASPLAPASAGRGRLDHRTGLVAAGIAALVTLAALGHSRNVVDPFPGRTFQRATAGLRCVMTDSNSALILMNRLSHDLADGCRNWIDVTGHTYFGRAKSDDLSRADNPVWQRDLQRYLLSGDAVVIARANGTEPSRATLKLVERNRKIAHGDGFALYRVSR